jgi:hypothetical protein
MTLLLLSLMSAPQANDGSKGFGIWQVDPTYTTGNLEFFLEIYVDPEAFPDQVEPTQADGSGTGELRIQNTTTTFEWISINGVKVGRLGPLTTAHVKGLAAGTYDVTIEYPHGFVYTKSMHTVAPEGPGLVRDPAVQPVEMPVPAEVPEAVQRLREEQAAEEQKQVGTSAEKKGN